MIPIKRWILSSVVVSSLVLGAASPAGAEDAEEAKRHFEKAQTAYKLGQFAQAIESYEAAYRALNEPAFLFNIAQAHRHQYDIDKKPFHLRKSLQLYKSYLRETPKPHNREVVIKLIDGLKEIISSMQRATPADSPSTGKLVLSGPSAAGAKIALDGKAIGQVPMTKELRPGTYVARITKAGHEPWSTTVTVTAGGEANVRVVLVPKSDGSNRDTADTPVYKKWWLWAIVGGVVAAGAGVGIGIAASGDSVPARPQIDLR